MTDKRNSLKRPRYTRTIKGHLSGQTEQHTVSETGEAKNHKGTKYRMKPEHTGHSKRVFKNHWKLISNVRYLLHIHT